MANELVAGVELGGTKCVCVLGTGPGDIRDQVRIPTTDPAETLANIESVLKRWQARGERFAALGIATFGPVQLNRDAENYGCITSTPKQGWRNTDVAMRLSRFVQGPTALDTDVNAAALAEGRWGSARGLNEFAYITVGTGIGVGLIVAGKPVVGFTHSELGHIRVARPRQDAWPGHCRFHGDCLEGLASGPAIQARTGMSADVLPLNHDAWSYVAHALGQLLHVLVVTTAPRRIIVGGGVMSARSGNAEGHLFARIRKELQQSLGNYIEAPEVEGDLDAYVVPPLLGDRAGPTGALLLASDALANR